MGCEVVVRPGKQRLARKEREFARFPLAERAAGAIAKRISPSTLRNCGVKLSKKERRCIAALFEKPLTTRHVTAEKWRELRMHFFGNLNNKFLRAYGKPAVVVSSPFHEGAARGIGFRVAHLNPELFEVSEVLLEPGKDVAPQDFLSPDEFKVLEFLAKNNFCPRSAIEREAGVSKIMITVALAERINKKCRALGLPRAISFELGPPHAYFVTRELAKTFSLKLKRWKPVFTDVFRQFELELIEFLALHGGGRCGKIASEQGWTWKDLWVTVRKCEERAEAFGLPSPFGKIGKGKRRRAGIGLAREFAKKTKLPPASQGRLELLFDDKQIRVINYFASHPHAKMRDAENALGLNYVSNKIESIERACKACHLPAPFKRAGRRIALNEEFAKIFGIEPKTVDVETLFSPRQKRVHAFFSKNPDASYKQAAKALTLSWTRVRASKKDCTRKLRALGLAEKTTSEGRLRTQLASFHEAFGRWPSEEDLNRLGRDSLVKKAAGFGGLKKCVSKTIKENAKPKAKLVESWRRRVKITGLTSVKIWDYSKFGGDGERVKNALTKALLEHAMPFVLMKQIFEESKRASEAIKKINEFIEEHVR